MSPSNVLTMDFPTAARATGSSQLKVFAFAQLSWAITLMWTHCRAVKGEIIVALMFWRMAFVTRAAWLSSSYKVGRESNAVNKVHASVWTPMAAACCLVTGKSGWIWLWESSSIYSLIHTKPHQFARKNTFHTITTLQLSISWSDRAGHDGLLNTVSSADNGLGNANDDIWLSTVTRPWLKHHNKNYMSLLELKFTFNCKSRDSLKQMLWSESSNQRLSRSNRHWIKEMPTVPELIDLKQESILVLAHPCATSTASNQKNYVELTITCAPVLFKHKKDHYKKEKRHSIIE